MVVHLAHVAIDVMVGRQALLIKVNWMQVLLSSESKEQVMSVMEDLSQLKVVPLLQGVLFGR